MILAKTRVPLGAPNATIPHAFLHVRPGEADFVAPATAPLASHFLYPNTCALCPIVPVQRVYC
jgi:hypothetical protein